MAEVAARGGAHRLDSVLLDGVSLASASKAATDERQVAVKDLLDKNSFHPEGAEGGPYALILGLVENRLAFDVTGPGYQRRHLLSLSPLKGVIKDYIIICDSYDAAIRQSSPGQIEAIDMGRRGLHNDGSQQLRERLAGKIEVDLETARRLFTLICALVRRT
jgi:uncharacterized protein (UPF0262 family)